MISLTQTGSPAETSAAYTLLAIIADPKAAKQRLDELVAEKQAAVDAMDGARSAVEVAAKDRAGAAQMLADVNDLRSKTDAEQGARAKQLADDQAILADKRAQVEKFDASARKREAAVAKRESDARAREDAVAAREAKVTETEQAAQALKDQYEAKVNLLKSAMK